LIQLGEKQNSVFVIGSPDLDLMNPSGLPDLNMVKDYYSINFSNYSIAMFHPVTTEYENIQNHAHNFVKALIESNRNYIVIFPNNDMGSIEILNEYKSLEGNDKFLIFPSLRFEYFLTLLKNTDYIIGNSSAGVREAPYYNVPTVDIGSRQHNRVNLSSVLHTSCEVEDILHSIEKVVNFKVNDESICLEKFGEGKSDKLFIELLNSGDIWSIEHQKQFQEI
jgi:UDP-N-acetylglucosamine 2-epimerase (hydrolysing)